MRSLYLSASCILLAAVGARGETVATYELVFTTLWTPDSHPTDFPPSPHFSGLVGATHTSSLTLWEPGGLASRGVKDVAEIGSKTSIRSEINTAIDEGTAGRYLSYLGISGSRVFRTESFSIRESYPLATIISMLAPSPDWFVGISGVELYGTEGWLPTAHFELYPYDAGTDSGTTFTSPNQATLPQQPISRLDGFPFAGTGPVASFDLQLLDVGEYVPPPPPIEPDADFNDDGRVDGADFLIWQSSFPLDRSGTPAKGDSDADGDVDGDDFLAWQAQFVGLGLGSAALASPEPGAALLAAIVACALAAPPRCRARTTRARDST